MRSRLGSLVIVYNKGFTEGAAFMPSAVKRTAELALVTSVYLGGTFTSFISRQASVPYRD